MGISDFSYGTGKIEVKTLEPFGVETNLEEDKKLKLRMLGGSIGHPCVHGDHLGFQWGLDKNQVGDWMLKSLIKERE